MPIFLEGDQLNLAETASMFLLWLDQWQNNIFIVGLFYNIVYNGPSASMWSTVLTLQTCLKNQNGPVQIVECIPREDYSVKRHIQNVHGGGAFLVSFVDYLVGRQAGYYLPSFPPTYETKTVKNLKTQ